MEEDAVALLLKTWIWVTETVEVIGSLLLDYYRKNSQISV